MRRRPAASAPRPALPAAAAAARRCVRRRACSCDAPAITQQLPVIRCGARSVTAVSVSDPAPMSPSRMIGNLRTALAASIRPYAACSERPEHLRDST